MGDTSKALRGGRGVVLLIELIVLGAIWWIWRTGSLNLNDSSESALTRYSIFYLTSDGLAAMITLEVDDGKIWDDVLETFPQAHRHQKINQRQVCVMRDRTSHRRERASTLDRVR